MQRIGRYDIVEQVGRGSMGVVYRAQDTVLEREVALKVLWEDFCDDENALARFQREARAVARLTHRNIVTLYELAQQEDGRPYIAMEFLRGAPLDKRLRTDPPLTLVERIDIVIQLCTGLHFAHEQGVVHRDVKPANIWVQPDGTVKLLDFGIARLSSSSMTRDGNVLGTASYMAPEQIEGAAVDGRADVFSAGVVLYELLAGHRPFEAESPTGVIAKILRGDHPPIDPEPEGLPPALAAAAEKALARRPEDRFATAAEFAAELLAVRRSLERLSIGYETLATQGGLAAGPVDVGTHAPVPMPGPVSIGDTGLTSGPPSRPGTAVPVAAPAPRRSWRGGNLAWLAVATVATLALVALAVRGWSPSRDAASPPAQPRDQASTDASRAIPSTAPAAGEGTLPAASRPVVLQIRSEPAGALVTFDGRTLEGVTPIRLELATAPRAGAELRIGKRGFEDARVTLDEDHLRTGLVEVTLRPSVARVTMLLTGPYPFEVYEGGRLVSPADTDHRLALTEGQQLRVRAPAYFLDARLTVRRGGDNTARYVAPALGSLSVRSVVENCDMLINGVRTDPPPIHQRAIIAGEHVVELRCGDGIERRRTASVAAGRDTLLRFTKD